MQSIGIRAQTGTGRTFARMAAFAGLLLLLAALPAAAQTPFSFAYSGFLEKNGTPLTTAVDVTVRLYDAASGGTLLHEETHAGVVPDNGIFNVEVGAGAATGSFNYAGVKFDVPYWLEVAVDDGTGAVTLAPRTKLLAVPYARNLALPAVLTSAASTPGIRLVNQGEQEALRIENTHTNPSAPTVTVTTAGTTNGIQSTVQAAGNHVGVVGIGTADGTTGVEGRNTATTGQGGYFVNQEPANTTAALVGETEGTGYAAHFIAKGASAKGVLITRPGGSSGDALRAEGKAHVDALRIGSGATAGHVLTTDVDGNGTWQAPAGGGGLTLPFVANQAETVPLFDLTNTGFGGALKGTTAGDGAGVLAGSSAAGNAVTATSTGTGHAGSFFIDSNDFNAYAVHATTAGQGHAGVFFVDNDNTDANAVRAETRGSQPAIYAATTGIGAVALFESNNNAALNDAVKIYGNGDGNALYVYHTATTSTVNERNLALFEADGNHVARIDAAGTGYFNGGTQSSGADVAEAFEVEGAVAAYEPGDVLVISTRTDRTVEKSGEARSTRVVGVYATRPGVLLSERSVDADHSDTVPMGVVGVIPTKVSAENGAIRRGDLLVTAATPGHAMRAGDAPAVGTVLGKALENFEGPGTGRIRVLVNVK